MNSEELTGAFESLQKLEHHYKNQYEDYLAKAMAAKANLDRLELLLKDLSSQFALYPEEQESFLEFKPEEKSTNGNSPQLELDWMRASLEEDTKPTAEPERTENQEISHREFVKLSSQVMPILQSIFAQDLGKKLHLSYLSKAVNQKSLLGLTPETIELFLDEAIALGYCDRDIYDKSCYYSVPDNKALVEEAFKDNPYKRTFEEKTTTNDVEEKQPTKQDESVTLTKPLHNLPPSPRVKMTLLSTIQGYIAECKPVKIKAQNVVDYLYSDSDQSSWSNTQNQKILHSIAATLSSYNNKEWRRLRTGVYKPLRPFQDDSNSVTEPEKTAFSSDPQERTNEDARTEQEESVTLTKPSHKLPPSPKVKMTVVATILGYLTECQPKTFTARDVVNYLYSEAEQKHWSKERKDQVIQAIAGSLSNSKNKKWKRIRIGVYKPLLPLEETVVKPTHNLPPSPRVKLNMLDTLLGYIEECQPKTFGSRDVLNYLYSDREQKQWTENQKDNNVTAINSALYSYFKQKKLKRVKMGVYCPI